jgi:anti-sigma factor RsiW
LSCELAQARLHAYLDGELDAVGSADFDQHLRNCPVCAGALKEQEALRQGLQQSRIYSRAPVGLKLRIEESLPGSGAHKSASLLFWRWLAVAAALLLAAFVGWWQLATSSQRAYKEIAVTAVDAHLRSLQPGHLVDVQSTDQHTVKPWFDGKLAFAPPVRDFASSEFPLLGGRLDVMEGRTVAALVYGRRKHFINVFVDKAAPNTSWNGSGEAQGYHWTAWHKDGFRYCAVSDVSAADLDQLKQLFMRE